MASRETALLDLPLFRALVREDDIIDGDYHIHWLEQFLAKVRPGADVDRSSPRLRGASTRHCSRTTCASAVTRLASTLPSRAMPLRISIPTLGDCGAR